MSDVGSSGLVGSGAAQCHAEGLGRIHESARGHAEDDERIQGLPPCTEQALLITSAGT